MNHSWCLLCLEHHPARLNRAKVGRKFLFKMDDADNWTFFMRPFCIPRARLQRGAEGKYKDTNSQCLAVNPVLLKIHLSCIITETNKLTRLKIKIAL